MIIDDIPVDLLDAVVSDMDICRIAAEYLVKWRELSPRLGLKPADETAISNTFKNFDDQRREVLRKWKELKGNAPTYRALIFAAEAIRNKQLADKVRKMEKNPDEGIAT